MRTLARLMRRLKLVYSTWHDGRTFVEEFYMDWEFLRMLHLRAAPELSTSKQLREGKTTSAGRQVNDYEKIDFGAINMRDAAAIL